MEMLSDRLLANQRFDFTSTAKGGGYKFDVVEMEGFEALSQPFRFTLTLVCSDASIDFDAMLSNPATFTIRSPEGGLSTPYHGVLAEFEQMHHAGGYVFYRAVLVPRLWNLSLSRISEVYLDEQPITDTLKTVLKNGGLTTNDFEFKLTGTYRNRSFVCQFEETYLEFVSRWTEHEGMYFCFDHKTGSDRLVVVDSVTMLDKARASETDELKVVPLAYRPDDRMNTGLARDAVRNFVLRARPLPKEVILQDYNYRKAAVQLKASAVVSAQGRGEVMIYGENFRDENEGKRYAKLRAEEILCSGRVFSGEGTAVGLRAGYFAKLAGHYREDFNAEYLVTEIHHRGSQAGALLSGVRSSGGDGGAGGETSYSNSFRAIASDIQFRPERVSPKPRITGTISATIDSEGDGPYADLDESGRYKVQLPFDLTDKRPNKGSARIRMATPYSGSGYGMDFPLLKGAEVLLSFTDGDPDRPVIMNAVPNSENTSVVTQTNPQQNLIVSAAGNKLCIDDTRGSEVITLSSPYKDSSISVGYTVDKGGFFVKTSGSSQSATAGVSNSLTAGAKNSISLTAESSLAAGIFSKYSLGLNTSYSASADVNWKVGQSITLDDASSSVVMKANANTKANEKVTLQGGQTTAISALVNRAKLAVRGAVVASLAANAAVAASVAGKMLKVYDDGKTNYTDDKNRDATLINSLSGAAVGVAVQAVVQGLARSIAKTLEDGANTHTSTMELDRNGIMMKISTPTPGAKTPCLAHLGFAVDTTATPGDTSVSQIKHDWTGTATGQLAMTQASTALSYAMTAGGAGGTVTLSSTGVKAESAQAVEAVSAATSAKVSPGQIALAVDAAATVAITMSAQQIEAKAGSTLTLEPTEVSLRSADETSGVEFLATSAAFAFKGTSGMTCDASGTKVYSSGIIKLG
ncbi:type VI secretion system tip protein TssI/VgrG [Caballeronia sp. J97]|uniref:type VI secretion system tip protein TssI/VgrG n=1 Tax=Caballeronia sp. J97 TaxID=2805429 RepID=UPI002AB176FA|nr:type VI secretion system tip protein TssI/VgrG [Caballeronia sp. J97]